MSLAVTERQIELQQIQLLKDRIEREKRRRESEKAQETPKVEITQAQAYIEAYPFYQFVEDTFPILEPGRRFFPGWHIDIIGELLQATVLGEVDHFIVNIPRRSMKSLLMCVMFPAWVWTFLPHLRFLYTSYSAGFAARDNKKTFDLIMSDYYQERWGNGFNFTTKKLGKELRNNKGGFRMVFKIGKGTGEGADWVVCDDPNSIEETESDTMLDNTNRGWDETSYNNVANRQTAVRGIIQQRTNENDLTGHILDNPDTAKFYEHLCLAMKFESDHPHQNTADNPLNLGKVSMHEKVNNSRLTVGEPKLWIDPRSKDAPDFENGWYREWYKKHFIDKGYTSKGVGQLLWENYVTEEIIERDTAHLKAYGEASQLQQRPIMRGGNYFNSALFEQVPLSKVPKENLIFCRSWDKGGTDNAGDPTIGLLMARTKTRPFFFYIFDIFEKQISFEGKDGDEGRLDKMFEVAEQDVADYITGRYDGFGEEVNEYFVVIEKEGGASGMDVSSVEVDKFMGYELQFFNPRNKLEIRAKPIKTMSEAGRIKLVRGFWNQSFIRQMERFKPERKKQQDDKIVAMVQAYVKLAFRSGKSSGSSSGSL